MLPLLDAIARITAERMLNSVLAGAVLTLLAWALLRVIGRSNSGTRFAVWFSILVAIPGLSLVPLLGAGSSRASSARIVLPEGWAVSLLVAWASIASLALLRVAFGVWRIHRLRRTCSSIDISALDSSVLETIAQFRSRRQITLLESDGARMPMAIGFFKPAVILPKWALAELSAAELRAVLLHEFAHLRRWDDWTNFFQKILQALFFFHPALWWLDRRLALDREMACDDIVIAATNNPRAYARCLVDVAEKSLRLRTLTLAQAAVHRVQHIALRVSEIMDSGRPRATRISKPALATITVLAGASLVGVLYSPILIAFQDSPKLEALRVVPDLSPAVGRELSMAAAIPAVRREKSTIAQHIPGKSLAATAKARQRATVLPAKFTAREARQPRVLRASMNSRTSLMPVESVLLVMRNGSVDSSGRVIWTLSVWRVTVFHPVQPASQERTAAKSI